jgi:hypothetical protein
VKKENSMTTFIGNEELEIQILNPVLNEGLYLAQDLCDPSSPDTVLYHRGELLTVFVLNTLSVAGYDFIPCMAEES